MPTSSPSKKSSTVSRPSKRIRPIDGIRIATEALLSREKFSGQVWDAAHADAAIMTAVSKVGLSSFFTSMDFLCEKLPYHLTSFPNIITEPWSGKEAAYVRRAMQIATGKVALLLPVSFLCQTTTATLMAETPLVRLYFLSKRPAHRRTDMVWAVWEKGSYAAPISRFL